MVVALLPPVRGNTRLATPHLYSLVPTPLPLQQLVHTPLILAPLDPVLLPTQFRITRRHLGLVNLRHLHHQQKPGRRPQNIVSPYP